MHISLFPYHYAFISPSVLSQPLSRPQIELNWSHLIKQMPEALINTGFRHFNPLFKLAESGLIQVILMWLSILFCIDNLYFFHTLFFVSHIFSTNPVPLYFFIIVCSSGGLQVCFPIFHSHRNMSSCLSCCIIKIHCHNLI